MAKWTNFSIAALKRHILPRRGGSPRTGNQTPLGPNVAALTRSITQGRIEAGISNPTYLELILHENEKLQQQHQSV